MVDTHPLIPVVEERIADLERLCTHYQVSRLDLIGSAATGAFDPQRSDLDFLVEFKPAVRGFYFDLLVELETLFGRHVDLVMESAIRNPYFRQSIEQARIPIYGISDHIQQSSDFNRAGSLADKPYRSQMELYSLKYLYDIQRAVHSIEEFTAGKTFDDYQDDYMMRLAVERLFGIIGEAMSGLARVDRPTAERVTDYQNIIAFRNVIIHQYPDLDDHEVWEKITVYLPTLASEVDALLSEGGDA